MSCGSGKREKTNPCKAVKPEITLTGPIGGQPPGEAFFQRYAAEFETFPTGQPVP
jgi:hypothetical protein